MATVYEPLKWQAAVGYGVSPDRCAASVHDSIGVGFHQCHRKGIVEHNGRLWCKQHSPEGEAKRKAEMDERDRLERLKWARKTWTAEAFGIVKQIAEGHNDPMTLAREYMAREPK